MRLEVYPNLNGMAGTERTIAHMRRLVEAGKVDPAVVLQAHKIVKKIDRNNWVKMASAIFQFVHDKVAYVRDPVGVEFVKSPGITLKTLTGDCDDQSVLYSALAESIGLKSRFKAVKADKRYPSEFSHVYSQVLIPKRGWMTADTIVPHARFGWEAKNFPGRTWEGLSGFIDQKRANMLGDSPLAAGSVGYADEPLIDGGSSFGDAFDSDDDDDSSLGNMDFDGGMWSNTPMLTSSKGSISTGADAPPDFWGGATDTPPGPAFLSRMLPPGVESLNGLQMGYVEDEYGDMWLAYSDGMGGWNPFKKLRKSIQKAVKKITPPVFRKLNAKITAPFKKLRTNIKKGLQKAGGRISSQWKKKVTKPLEKAVKKLGHELAKGVGLSTPQSREKAARMSVEAALQAAWAGEGVQVGVALNERIRDMLDAIHEGRMPKWSKGPPPSMQGLISEMGRMPRDMDGMGGFTAAVVAVAGLLKGLGAKEDKAAAEKALKKYVTDFPSDRLTTANKNAAQAYIAAGGMMPAAGEAASAEWLAKWRSETSRKGKSNKGVGWTYHDLWQLIHDLEQSIKPLEAAKQTFAIAHRATMKAEGPQTIQTAASVVEKAIKAGEVRPEEVKKALLITKKKAQGFKLTPQEQELAARIARGARAKQGAGKGVLIAVPAAIAAGAALLL